MYAEVFFANSDCRNAIYSTSIYSPKLLWIVDSTLPRSRAIHKQYIET